MFKVETSTLEEYFVADLRREIDLPAVARRAGTAGHRPAGAAGGRTIGAVVRTGKRGAL